MSKHVSALAAVIGAVAFGASMGWDALDPHTARLVSINGGFAARHDAQKLRDYCGALADDIKSGRVADDSLWVVFPRYAAEIMAASPRPLALHAR